MTLTETPVSESSIRSESKKPICACLVAAYALRCGTPHRPARLEIATICPRLRFRCGSA